MSWTTSNDELRKMLSDGPTDRLRAFKKVFGQIDGSNKIFKTFEFRRVTDFTTAASPLGVYINGVLQSNASFSSDDIATGYFNFVTAPAAGSIIEATYYIQWFNDSELTQFISDATRWLGFGTDPNAVSLGLQPSALKYAGYVAYEKLALKWVEKLSETYRLEDAPDAERFKSVDTYRNISQQFLKDAHQLRDDFYTRQGQSLSPLFGILSGTAKDIVPRR